MLTGKNFIVFSDDWGRHPFSCQHIMEHFLAHNKLLWVNTIGMRTPEFTLYDMKRALGKIRSWVQKPQQQSDADISHPNLRIISPFMIPYNIYPPVRKFNAKSVVKAVRKAAHDWDFTDPIVLTTQPLAADYIGKLDEKLVAYYCVDDFVHWPGMNQPELVQSLENDLLNKSDLVFTVSDALCASRTNGKNPSRLLTHGVDIAHFSKASMPQALPQEMQHAHAPIIGFYGLIDHRFDMELVKEILSQKPSWHIVCVGNTLIDLEPLKAFANFHWIGAVSYKDLPMYAAHFDVAFIPYVINEHTHTINPLKLREYIATGKAVVTTPMREAYRFENVIHIAEKGLAFIAAIEQALQHPIDSSVRAQSLHGESWEDKAQFVSTWIEEKLHGTTIHKEKKHD